MKTLETILAELENYETIHIANTTIKKMKPEWNMGYVYEMFVMGKENENFGGFNSRTYTYKTLDKVTSAIKRKLK
jgi:hypothetical protein